MNVFDYCQFESYMLMGRYMWKLKHKSLTNRERYEKFMKEYKTIEFTRDKDLNEVIVLMIEKEKFDIKVEYFDI